VNGEPEGLVRAVVESAGLELVDVAFGPQGPRRVLRVTVDRDGGVDLDPIAQVSERISRRLDLEGFAPGPYSLEVSSPGLERPLRRPGDFARSVGERVKVKLTGAADGGRVVTGRILAAGEDEVRVDAGDGERAIRYDEISSARTVFDWPAAGQRAAAAKGVKR
jgi:ribosome maturation factor RimP